MTEEQVAKLITLLLLAPAVAIGAVNLLRSVRGSAQQRVLAVLFALLCLDGVRNWPAGIDWQLYPLTTLRMLAPALVLAAWHLPPRARRFSRGAMGIAAALACVYALRVLLSMRPAIASNDFFAYVCYARDRLAGIWWPNQYEYFPGVYDFWEAVLRISPALASLQWAFAGLLALNAALCGVLVFRCTRSILLAVFTGALELVLAFSVQGDAGTSEPICTAPLLAAMAFWGGESFAGRRGFWRAAALGAGFGMATFGKQQGGLLALGFAVLPAFWLVDRRDDLRLLALVPAAAFAACGLLFAFDGGLHALSVGLAGVSPYAAEGTLISNLRHVAAVVWPLGSLAVLCGLSGVFILVSAPQLLSERWMRAGALSLAAGAVTLAQFRWRPYFHYALLPLPMLIAGVALIGRGLWLMAGRRASEVTSRLAPLLAVAALVQLAASSPLPFFALSAAPAPAQEWPLGPAQRELDAISPPLEPASGAMVIPPMHSGVHFLIGTRSLGYGEVYFWGDPKPGEALAAVRDPRVRLVAVRPRFAWGSEVSLCAAAGCAEAVRALPSLGYAKIAATPEIVLYRR